MRAYNRYGRKWGAYNSKGKTVTIPAVPGKVNITQTNATSSRNVTITWDKTNNATSYRVFYKKSGAKKWLTVANVSAAKKQLHPFKQQENSASCWQQVCIYCQGIQ